MLSHARETAFDWNFAKQERVVNICCNNIMFIFEIFSEIVSLFYTAVDGGRLIFKQDFTHFTQCLEQRTQCLEQRTQCLEQI